MPSVAIDATLVAGSNTGDSSYWTGLLGGLEKLDSEFRFILLSNRELPSGLSLGNRFAWKRLPARNRRWLSLVTMPLAARKLGADVFHTQYTLSPLARNGITTIHDVSFFIGPQWFKPRDLLLMRGTVPGSAKRAKAVITVSETSRSDIVEHLQVDPSKVFVTYNAAAPFFRPTDPEDAKREFGIDGPYILTIGARWPRKNLALAIRAAGLLPKRVPHDLLVIGKEGWGDEGGNSRTVSTGYIPNAQLPALYSGASLYLFPSFYEGFGIPMLEAFACGTPVLASNGGALPEVSGGAAEIMEDWTPEAWAARIEALLSDSSKLAQMVDRGVSRAAEFTWENAARKTLDVYRKVCT